MRVFFVKLAGLIIVALVLFTYQSQAHNLAVIREAIDTAESRMDEIQGDQMSQDNTDENSVSTHEYKDGTYTGTGQGFSGDMTAEVTVKDGQIENITISDTGDDKAYLDRASAIIDDIIEKQTIDGIDTVSGATFSSNGILEAVRNALTESEG